MLRSTPKYLPQSEIPSLLRKWNFFHKELNWDGEFANDFTSRNMTVFDRASGLMWMRNEYARFSDFTEALLFLKSFNRKASEGYRDWRLPTLEEAASLLFFEQRETDSHYIHPSFFVFSTGTHCMLTADSVFPGVNPSQSKWTVDFLAARFLSFLNRSAILPCRIHLRPCRTHADPARLLPALPAPRPNCGHPSTHGATVARQIVSPPSSDQIAPIPVSHQGLPASRIPPRSGRRPENRNTVAIPLAVDDVPQIILLNDR